MTDPTDGRLTRALEIPNESETAGRRAFLAIVWLTALLGLTAHIFGSVLGPRR